MSESSTINPTKEISEMKFLSVQENKCITSTTWDIENFSKITDTLESPHFYMNNKSQTWSLQVYPNGDSSSAGYVSIYLTPHFNSSISVDVNILLLNSKKDEIINAEFTHTFSGKYMYGYVTLIKRNFLLAKLNDDILTLHCELLVENDIKCLDHSLGRDFGKVLGVFDFSDVTLSVDGKNFNLHKVILSARSPVFAAMFKHPMEESTTNIVNISGISAAVMDEVVRYIYTDQTPHLKEMVGDILSVADKYDLQCLKERCVAELNLQLAVNNAARALELADMYSLAQLKEEVIYFIARNIKKVIESPMWIELTSSNSSLTSSILSEIIMDHLNIS